MLDQALHELGDGDVSAAPAAPRLLVVESARVFDAEAASLVGVFARYAGQWRVLSNDSLWPDAGWPTQATIANAIDRFVPDIVHFALHGLETGLLLRISDTTEPGLNDVMLWEEISEMPQWRGRVIVTGACGMLNYAHAFLHAGATAVVAPGREVDWANLCHFFRLFYSHLLRGRTLADALAHALDHAAGYYREFGCIGIAGNAAWTMRN